MASYQYVYVMTAQNHAGGTGFERRAPVVFSGREDWHCGVNGGVNRRFENHGRY